MKIIFAGSIKLAALSLLLAVFSAMTAHAQNASMLTQGQSARVQLPNLDGLEARAAQVVDVTLDERMLRIAWKFLSDKDPDQVKIKELVSGLKGVYVKSYEFDKDNEYSITDVESVRTQVRGPGWSRMVGVRSKDGANVEVYTLLTGDHINGMTVIAAEPRQLTLVNIVGFIDLDKLSQLQGNFGIPKLDISRDNRKPRKE